MRRLAGVLFWLGLLGIGAATLGPIDFRPESGLPPQVERFGAFLAVSLLFTLAYPRRRVGGWLVLLLVAGLLEILQNDVPGRHGRVPDFEAKALGVLFGAAAGVAMARLKAFRFQDEFSSHGDR